MQYIVRKERGVFLQPEQATANLDAGQLDAVQEWFAVYGQTQEIHDALYPIRVYQPFTSDGSGYVAFPVDYLHLIGNPYTVYGSSVRILKFVKETELAYALTSQLRPVTNTDPIVVGTANGFVIYPQNTQQGVYWYLRRPAKPVFGYAQSGRTITYDPNTSVQLEFVDAYINHIIAKALVYTGVNMSDAEIVAFASQYNKETQ